MLACGVVETSRCHPTRLAVLHCGSCTSCGVSVRARADGRNFRPCHCDGNSRAGYLSSFADLAHCQRRKMAATAFAAGQHRIIRIPNDPFGNRIPSKSAALKIFARKAFPRDLRSNLAETVSYRSRTDGWRLDDRRHWRGAHQTCCCGVAAVPVLRREFPACRRQDKDLLKINGGRYRDRTYDPTRVKGVLSR